MTATRVQIISILMFVAIAMLIDVSRQVGMKTYGQLASAATTGS